MQNPTAGTHFQWHTFDLGSRFAAETLAYGRIAGNGGRAVNDSPGGTGRARRITEWPTELASIGAIRFARRSPNFEQTVRFYRELVGLPLYETFENSYGSNGAIFGMPDSTLTFEVVEAVGVVPVDHHEGLCLYFPDEQARQAATARLRAAGVQPVESHPYWAATGAVAYRDPDGREVVFAPFAFGVNEPAASAKSGKHEFPAG